MKTTMMILILSSLLGGCARFSRVEALKLPGEEWRIYSVAGVRLGETSHLDLGVGHRLDLGSLEDTPIAQAAFRIAGEGGGSISGRVDYAPEIGEVTGSIGVEVEW